MSVRIRDSEESDLPAVRAIYAHHVRHGFGSFEETPPPVEELARRRQDVLSRGLPYLVAEATGKEILGYSYAGPYRTRSAYRFSVESSVYVAPGAERRGLGKILLETLIARCAAAGMRQMIAVIGDAENEASIRLHEALGFRRVGTLDAVGFKRGRWLASVLMQRPLGAGGDLLPDERGTA